MTDHQPMDGHETAGAAAEQQDRTLANKTAP
jgi:hypothetical protein